MNFLETVFCVFLLGGLQGIQIIVALLPPIINTTYCIPPLHLVSTLPHQLMRCPPCTAPRPVCTMPDSQSISEARRSQQGHMLHIISFRHSGCEPCNEDLLDPNISSFWNPSWRTLTNIHSILRTWVRRWEPSQNRGIKSAQFPFLYLTITFFAHSGNH